MTATPIPRAGLDPIRCADQALAVINAVISDPPTDETVLVLLDTRRTGTCIVIVNGTSPPDRVVDAVEAIAEIAGDGDDDLEALVVASIRPGGGIDPGDGDRWLEMSDLTAAAGLELVEWFVLGDDIDCPRDLLGEPPRW